MKYILKAFLFAPLLAFAFAEEKESPVRRLRRQLQVAAKNFGRKHSGNLGLCEGDCDTNAECRGDLVCFQRNAGDNVPGCSLTSSQRSSRADFCVVARQSGTPRPPTPAASPVRPPAPVASPVAAVRAPTSSGGTTAVYVGNDNVSNLGLCQGDCDTNQDCAPGLRCHQRSRGQAAPGCNLGQSLMNSDNDFCVRETSTSGGSTNTGGSTSSGGSGSTGNSFALKLYWEAGYDWQNEPFERKWCMSCRGSCGAGAKLAIFDCADSPTQWQFVSHGPNEVQIKVANRDVCLEEKTGNTLELAQCDSNNQKQRFVAFGGSFNDRRFEVSPKQRQGWCMTQRHHPRNNESVNVEPCVTARRDGSNTSYWNKY